MPSFYLLPLVCPHNKLSHCSAAGNLGLIPVKDDSDSIDYGAHLLCRKARLHIGCIDDGSVYWEDSTGWMHCHNTRLIYSGELRQKHVRKAVVKAASKQ